MTLKAILFDVDGTLAETEEIHRKAFNRAFADAGLDWHWSRERYRSLLTTSGGKERIRRYMAEENAPSLSSQWVDINGWIAELHQAKTKIYADMMAAGEVELRPGVERLIREARQAGLKLAIATTTTPDNIRALFQATLGEEALAWFDVIGDAETSPEKKPDPSVYLHVLEQLALTPQDCVAIEDTRNGVLAARAASVPVLVTQSFYSEGEDFDGAFAVLSDLGEPDKPCRVISGVDDNPCWVEPERLARWHAQAGQLSGTTTEKLEASGE